MICRNDRMLKSRCPARAHAFVLARNDRMLKSRRPARAHAFILARKKDRMLRSRRPAATHAFVRPVLQNMLQCGYLCLDGEVGEWIAYFREGAG